MTLRNFISILNVVAVKNLFGIFFAILDAGPTNLELKCLDNVVTLKC